MPTGSALQGVVRWSHPLKRPQDTGRYKNLGSMFIFTILILPPREAGDPSTQYPASE